MMLIILFMGLVGLLTGVMSRDIKPAKSLPAISNSLVNFGKMDFSFYLGDKYKDVLAKPDSYMQPATSLFSSTHDTPLDEPCPCSNLRHMKDPFSSHPSDVLNKILMSNDLFSYNKELLTSTLCCDSHENVREEGVFFEFSPKQNQIIANPMQANSLLLPSLAKVLENFFSKKPMLPVDTMKSPAIDLFLFPKKKSIGGVETGVFKKKADIHAVGLNEIKENIFNITPAFANKSSVKKDLGKRKSDEEPLPASDIKRDVTASDKTNTV